LLLGVEELKNASQLAEIAAVVADEPPPALADALFPAGVAGVEAGVDAGGVVVGLDALEQAVIAVAIVRPSAGTRKIRRAV
jgi:hypothetical protein